MQIQLPFAKELLAKKSERSERQPRLRTSLRPWFPSLFRPSIPLLNQPKLLNNDQRRNDGSRRRRRGSRRERKTLTKWQRSRLSRKRFPSEVPLVNLHAGSNLINDRDLAVKVAHHLRTDIKRELAKEGWVPMGLDEGMLVNGRT